MQRGVPIIDIRRASEWQDTGVIKQSNLITFFNKKGNYNLKDWLSKLKKIAKEDPKEFTSYLTRRPLLTNKKTDESINLALSKIWSKKKFYKVKLSEQEERYKSFFSTEYNLEPNLKESPGTLRDFQTSLWILQHCFDLENIDGIKKSKEFGNEIDENLSQLP